MSSLDPVLLFFFNDTATTEIYTLSLHDALPISPALPVAPEVVATNCAAVVAPKPVVSLAVPSRTRSEEHTSELQSLAYVVCRLLLESKPAVAVSLVLVAALMVALPVLSAAVALA